jgi:hypothetical protein
MSAFASSRMALAAASPYAAGRTTVGGAGQGGSRHLGSGLDGYLRWFYDATALLRVQTAWWGVVWAMVRVRKVSWLARWACRDEWRFVACVVSHCALAAG